MMVHVFLNLLGHQAVPVNTPNKDSATNPVIVLQGLGRLA